MTTFSFVLPDVIADPYPHYQRIRAEEPVYWDEVMQGFMVLRYDDVAALFRDPRSSAARLQSGLALLPPAERDRIAPLYQSLSRWVLFLEGAAHTRLRPLVAGGFLPRIVKAMRPSVERVVDELLEPIRASRRMDAIRDLAYPLPAIVIAEVLGVPPAERDRFKGWSLALADFFGAGRPTPATALRAQAAVVELEAYMKGIIADHRAQPRDDLLSAFLGADESGQRLTEKEILSTCAMLLFAGHETTTNLIGNGLLALLRHPDELARLRADRSLLGSALEELLRYDAPVQVTTRVVLEDLEVAGCRVPAGKRLALCMGSANRDPAQFEDPDRLDLGRRDNRHLSFGLGGHFCLGAPLARLEAEVAFSAVLDRMPELRLAGETPRFRPNAGLRGLESLPVVF
jgi:cytochrome P450